MKKSILLTIISMLFAEGLNVQLLSFLPYDEEASDITGFAQDGREFAVMGLYDGATFVDVTDPYNPFEVGFIPGSGSIWRDLKYWDEHVYIGTEANDGIKVVDVSDLDNPTLVNTITDVDNSHNIHVDADGYLYIVGADNYDIWIYDLSDPANPELVGTWLGEYLHDIEVYNNKIYGAAIYSGYFYIIDVSDKSNPQTLVSYDTGGGYISTHDCAVTFNEQYLITADETMSGHIKIFDVSNYSNINQIGEYYTPDYETHTSHNIYIQESTGLLIISYYADGTRFVDISDPTYPVEVGYYDTTQLEDLYTGNWGTYVDLPSGNIVSSDIEQGLFVLKFGGLTIEHDPITDTENTDQIDVDATVTSMTSQVESVLLNLNTGNGFTSTEMEPQGDDMYHRSIPSTDGGNVVQYYLTATDGTGDEVRFPIDGYIEFIHGELDLLEWFDFEDGEGDWTAGIPSDDASAGIWEWGNPNGTEDSSGEVQPENDHSPYGTNCFVTGNGGGSIGADDVDGGVTTLLSPQLELEGYGEIYLSYWRWYINNAGDNPGSDHWRVDVSNNGGTSWVNLEDTQYSSRQWVNNRYILSDYIEVSNNMQFRFTAEDIQYPGDNGNGGSLVEAALDDVYIYAIPENSCAYDGDTNGDGGVNVLDIVNTVNAILDEVANTSEFICIADMNMDGVVNILDIVNMVNIILD